MADICVDGTIRRGELRSSAKGATMVRSVGDGVAPPAGGETPPLHLIVYAMVYIYRLKMSQFVNFVTKSTKIPLAVD